MAQQNKQVTSSDRSVLEKVEDNYESKSNNSDKKIDVDQLDKLNLRY